MYLHPGKILLEKILQSDPYFLVELSNLSSVLFSHNMEVCNHDRYDNYKLYVVLIYGINIHNRADRRYLVLQFKKKKICK